MPVHFNHLAVAAKDKQRSARFLKDLLGLPEPTTWGPFLSLTLDDGVRIDYAEPGVEFPGQHYALLVSDDVLTAPLSASRPTACLSGPVPATRRERSTPTTAAGGLFRRPGRASL